MARDIKGSKENLGFGHDLGNHLDERKADRWLDKALQNIEQDRGTSPHAKDILESKRRHGDAEKKEAFFLDDHFSFFESTMKKNAEEKCAADEDSQGRSSPRRTRIMNDEHLNADPRDSSSLGVLVMDPRTEDMDNVKDAFDKCLFAALNEPDTASAKNRADQSSGNSFLRLGQLVSPISDGVSIAPSVLPSRNQSKKASSALNRQQMTSNPEQASDLERDTSFEMLSINSFLVDENNDALDCSGGFPRVTLKDLDAENGASGRSSSFLNKVSRSGSSSLLSDTVSKSGSSSVLSDTVSKSDSSPSFSDTLSSSESSSVLGLRAEQTRHGNDTDAQGGRPESRSSAEDKTCLDKHVSAFGEKIQHTQADSEVYASRFFNEDGHISHLGFANRQFEEDASQKALKHLHPDDRFSMPSPEDDLRPVRFSTVNYVCDHLFIHENRKIFGRAFSCISRISELERMMQKIFEASTTLNPRLITLKAEYPFEVEMFLESILERCQQRAENITFYATCDREIYDSQSSCFRALIASRVGYSPDVRLTTERLVRSAAEIVDGCDKIWAQKTLFSAFGIEDCMISNGDLGHQSMDLCLAELFLKGIEHDAECGPVVVVLTHADKYRFDGWREVVEYLRNMHAPNVTLIICGDAVSEIEGTERLELGRIPDVAMRYYVSEIFSRAEALPEGFVDALVSKSLGSYTRLWHMLKILELRGMVKQQEKGISVQQDSAALVYVLPSDMAALAHEHFSSLSADQRYLCAVAAMMDMPFTLEDMSLILSLDTLEGEVPWFCNLRQEWVERVVRELVDVGEIQVMADAGRAVRYMLCDRDNARHIVSDLETTFVQAVHGCYAQILQRHNASDAEIAYHFEQAGMHKEAAHAWLKLAERRRRDYCNQTSLTILNHCLTYMSPQYGASFVALQRELGCLATHFGVFQMAYEHYSVMLRVAHLLRDTLQSVEAFIGVASSLLSLGNYSSAKEMMAYGMQLAEQLNQRPLLARCYRQMADIIFRAGDRGMLSESMRYVERANEIWRDLGDLPELAKTLSLSAEILMRRGELVRTREALSEAYYALKNSGMQLETPPALAVFAELSICENKYRDAAKYIQEGMEIVHKTDNRVHLVELLFKRAELNITMTNREAVREDLARLEEICQQHGCTPWLARLRIMTAEFDFSRKSFQKATKSIKAYFEVVTGLKNHYLTGLGYALSARLNFEVFKRELGRISLEKTDKLFRSSTSIFEGVGAWHKVAENLRCHAEFLDMSGQEAEARRCRERAEKVDPFCQ